ncbi:unnamed protein product, partial [Ectocarpus sp. 8 AP-2014]
GSRSGLRSGSPLHTCLTLDTHLGARCAYEHVVRGCGMRRTAVTILFVQVLVRFSCVATVLEARRDALSPDDATSTAAATAGGTGRVIQHRATESDVKAAARHCVTVDEDGRFPANHALGLFETEPGR